MKYHKIPNVSPWLINISMPIIGGLYIGGYIRSGTYSGFYGIYSLLNQEEQTSKVRTILGISEQEQVSMLMLLKRNGRTITECTPTSLKNYQLSCTNTFLSTGKLPSQVTGMNIICLDVHPVQDIFIS